MSCPQSGNTCTGLILINLSRTESDSSVPYLSDPLIVLWIWRVLCEAEPDYLLIYSLSRPHRHRRRKSHVPAKYERLSNVNRQLYTPKTFIRYDNRFCQRRRECHTVIISKGMYNYHNTDVFSISLPPNSNIYKYILVLGNYSNF